MSNSHSGSSKSDGGPLNHTAILQIEDLANQGELLLAAEDFEGAFLAWLNVYRIAEEIFGMDDEVSVDALRLAMNSLGYLQRFNSADQLLRLASDSDLVAGEQEADQLKAMVWTFSEPRPHHLEEHPVQRPSTGVLQHRRCVHRGSASSFLNPLQGEFGHRLPTSDDD
ncbi:MAG: hypothetical protein MK085_00400 [Phycisphaerales bacterium]|nr:hypothetical protein [Phycisphaerales bacterium]